MGYEYAELAHEIGGSKIHIEVVALLSSLWRVLCGRSEPLRALYWVGKVDIQVCFLLQNMTSACSAYNSLKKQGFLRKSKSRIARTSLHRSL